MKTRSHSSNASSKPRPRRTRTTNLREVDQWLDDGAEFLRAVTSGSRVRDDRMSFDGVQFFSVALS